jgi:hypothetical protein
MYDLNSFDAKTKYVLAHLFVEKRTKQKCNQLFTQIKETCYGQILSQYKKEKHKKAANRKLVIFVSDGFENYKSAATKLFYRTANIVAGVPIACKKYGLEHNNNPIERYNGSLKDRIKILRGGFGSFEGAESFMDLKHVIHNFVNPHQGLKGKTPAEAAGIKLLLGRQKLLNLIKLGAKLEMTKR